MTSVLGHLTDNQFEAGFENWHHPPPNRLFDAPVKTFVAKVCGPFSQSQEILIKSKDKVAIAKNIETQARFCKALFIWTDCDREGEHIGAEVREQALKGNPRLIVKRAKFSNIERG
jgi:DNA topoisomerase-3